MNVKMDLTTVRLYGSLVVILGCFFFLYPKLMHPLVMILFGMNEKPEPSTATLPNDLPPHLRDKVSEAKHGGMRDDLPDHIRRMRSGPHPGMRAAAAEQSKQPKGSGRGMMGVILPMYAIGIVVYLVYTLFKVFNKEEDKQRDKSSPTRKSGRSSRYEENGDNSEDEGRVSRLTKDLVTPQELQNELQSLVEKVQDKNLTEMDMRKLQERLAETESQMTKILAAMQAVQGKVDVAATSAQDQGQTMAGTPVAASNSPQDTSNNQGSESAQNVVHDEKNKGPQGGSTESSPGSSESYEIVNKDTVETILAKTVPERPAEQNQDDDNDEVEEEEPEELLMEEKKKEEDEITTVRQRITKTEDADS